MQYASLLSSKPLFTCKRFIFAVQSHRCVQLFVTPWTAALQASLSFTISQNLLKLMSIESMMPSNHLHPLSPPSFPALIFPSIKVFSNVHWSLSFTICPSNEYSELISFRIGWLDLLGVQETLESSPAPQFESINSLALSLHYGPTLTCVHDYWKDHTVFSVSEIPIPVCLVRHSITFV